MINFDKAEIKNNLTIEDIFVLLLEWGGDPFYQNEEIIVSKTICHNHPNSDASHKLYYYNNNKLFHCFTGGCAEPSFDIFELVQKVMRIQYAQKYDLNTAVRYIGYRFGLYSFSEEQIENLKDWDIFNSYQNLTIVNNNKELVLKEYNDTILSKFNYKIKIKPWLDEGITQEALNQARIGFYPGEDKITIPHFDKDGRFIGLRGRTLIKEDAERFGKYMPLKIQGQLYSHPLGMTLYNLNNAKENISIIKTAIVAESEKSALLYASYFGLENNICVAVCGSNFSYQQMQLLLEVGAQEVVVAFDRQYKEWQDEEWKVWTKKLERINKRFKNDVRISFLLDKEHLLGYKDSPLDRGKDVFLQLYKKRFIL